MRTLRLLNLRRLARIRIRTVVAVVAVAAGSSLALSVVVVTSSLSASLDRFGRELAGPAPLRVVGATTSGGLDAGVLGSVTATPGVALAVPVVQAVTVAHGAGGRVLNVVVLGVDCRSAVLLGATSCPFSPGTEAPGGLVLVAPALERRLGSTPLLQTDTGAVSVAGAGSLGALGRIDNGAVVVMDLGRAQALFDRAGRLDTIYVTPTPGTSLSGLRTRLERAVGPWNGVLGAGEAPPAVALATGAFIPLLTLLAVLASGIAAVLVYNVVALSLEERRRELAIVAAVGAPPGVLVLGPLLEAGVLGAVGGLLGTAGGTVLAGPVVGSLSTFTLQFVGVPVTVEATWQTALTGLAVGAAIGLVAAARPVRRALATDVAAELSGRDLRARSSARSTVGTALVVSALAGAGLLVGWLGGRHGSLAPWQPDLALGGFLVATLAVVVAVGSWTPVVLRLLLRNRPRRGLLDLGVANLVREPGRTGVMAVAVAATVALALVTASYNRSVTGNIASSVRHTSGPATVDVSTVAGLAGYNSDARVPATALDALARLEGVAGVGIFQSVLTGHQAGRLTLVQTADHIGTSPPLLEGRADDAAFGRGQVMVGAGLARRDHLHPGGTAEIDTPTGYVPVTVQGIWDDGNVGGDNVTMPLTLERRLFGAQLPEGAQLDLAPGQDPATVAARARAAELDPFLVYSTPTRQLATDDASVSAQLQPFWALQRALLLVAFVSVLSTLLLVGAQRRREFGLLAAVGLTPGELFALVVAEAVSVGLVGAVLGIAMGTVLLAALLQITPLFVGFHNPYVLDLGSLVVALPLAVAAAAAASLWPARRAARLPILEALHHE